MRQRGADQEKLNEIVRKDSKEGRSLGGFWEYITASLGILLVLFYFYQAGIAPVDDQYSLGVYVIVTYVLVFLSYQGRAGAPMERPSIPDIVLALLSILAVGYWIVEFEDLNYRMGAETSAGHHGLHSRGAVGAGGGPQGFGQRAHRGGRSVSDLRVFRRPFGRHPGFERVRP